MDAKDAPPQPPSRPREHPRTTRRWPARLLATLLVFAWESTLAQTCATPVMFPDPAFPYVSGNTGWGEYDLPAVCGQFSAPGPSFVFRVNIDGWMSTQIRLEGGGPGFNPVMYITDGAQACGVGDCQASGEVGVPIQTGDLPPGTHWLIVTADDFNSPGAQGDFFLTIDGLPPDGDSDLIFEDGFE